MGERFENPYIIDCVFKNVFNSKFRTKFIMASEIALCEKDFSNKGIFGVIVTLKGHTEYCTIGEFDNENDMDRFYNKVRAKMEVLTTPITISLK
jgi:hypothetical protein